MQIEQIQILRLFCASRLFLYFFAFLDLEKTSKIIIPVIVRKTKPNIIALYLLSRLTSFMPVESSLSA